MLLPAGHTVSRHVHHTIALEFQPLPSKPFTQHLLSPSNHHQHMSHHVTATSQSRSIEISFAAICCARSSLLPPAAGQILHLPCLRLFCQVKTLACLHLSICRVKTLALQRCLSPASRVQSFGVLAPLGVSIPFTKATR